MKTKDCIFTPKFLLNLCFYKTPNNSVEVKYCDLVKTAGMLKQIFAIQCSDAVRAKSLRISILQEISTFHVLFPARNEKKKLEDFNIPGFQGELQVATNFTKHPSTGDWHLRNVMELPWYVMLPYPTFFL